MWKNRPFYELVEWMRKRASSDGPYVFGMDCYCKEEAKEEVLNFFDFYDRDGLGKDHLVQCLHRALIFLVSDMSFPRHLQEFRRSLYPVEQPDQCLGEESAMKGEFGRRDLSCNFLFSFEISRDCSKPFGQMQ